MIASQCEFYGSLLEQILLEQERVIYLRSEEDVKVFLEALNNPPEPNSALQNAAYWHKCLFGATETE